MAAPRNKYGLTAKQEAFAVNYACKGMTKSEAYRLAYKTGNMDQKTVWESACRLSTHHKVAARIDELLSEMQADDVVSSQKVLRQMRDISEIALQTGQPGVAMQATDRLMRHKALLTDKLVTSREGVEHDQDIIKTLAQGDERKERLLRQIIGSDEAFAPLEAVEDDDKEPASG